MNAPDQYHFEQSKLEVYKVAVEFARWADGLKGRLKGKAWLNDQLTRAAGSVVLNIAEGAQQRSKGVKRRHYETALGSAGECDSALDLVEVHGVQDLEEGRALIRRVGAMLAKLAR